jgi:xanthine dehydrogenase accessory factor
MTPLRLPDWPTFGYADDVRPAMRRAREARRPAALATIVSLEGGGPRAVGAQMLISQAEAAGFLSGGCVEGDIAMHAALTIGDGQPRRLVYGRGSPWPDIQLLCGARMEVLLERLAFDDPAAGALLDLYDQRRPAWWISDGYRRLCAASDAPAPWDDALARYYPPPCRLIVLGRDPSAMAMASLGAQSGMDVCLIRHLGPDEPPPLPGVAYRGGDAVRALRAMGPDRWTAIAVANHDAETDHLALVEALQSDAFYIGLLGARRRLPSRLADLKAAGLGKGALARLRAPIGIDIGGKAPWAIAVSVIAEVMSVWNHLEADRGSPPKAKRRVETGDALSEHR